MSGRAWFSVLLMATLAGYASRFQTKLFLPSTNIPLECAASLRVDCMVVK
jgi:hypothetical protein